MEGFITEGNKKERTELQFGSKTSRNLSQDILKILQFNNFKTSTDLINLNIKENLIHYPN